jgi:hypothetical protein
MIEGYEDIMKEWSAPSIGHGCCNTVTINPADELDRWAVQQTITILANADYYYTKAEVDSLLKQIKPGMTPEEVQAMINRSIASKAEQADLEALSAQVATNTERILNTYTKQEVNRLLASYYTKIQTNSLFANYSKVEDTTLILNSENIS